MAQLHIFKEAQGMSKVYNSSPEALKNASKCAGTNTQETHPGIRTDIRSRRITKDPVDKPDFFSADMEASCILLRTVGFEHRPYDLNKSALDR